MAALHNLADHPVRFREPDPTIVEQDDAVIAHARLLSGGKVAPDKPDAIWDEIGREGAIAAGKVSRELVVFAQHAGGGRVHSQCERTGLEALHPRRIAPQLLK